MLKLFASLVVLLFFKILLMDTTDQCFFYCMIEQRVLETKSSVTILPNLRHGRPRNTSMLL